MLAGGCSVADNLTGYEILAELSAIVAVEGATQGRDWQVTYRDDADVSAWYMRNFLLVPLRGLLGALFGRTEHLELENPSSHVRELIAELPDETGEDLLPCALASSRLAWLLELDRNPETRVLAMDGLVRICEALRLEPFVGPFDYCDELPDEQRIAVAFTGLDLLQPAQRGAQEVDGATLIPYRDALATLTAVPLERWFDRIGLVERLSQLYAEERDWRARSWVAAALRRSMEHAVRWGLLRVVRERDPKPAEVRQCALQQIRRLGGPEVVPLLLAVMAAVPEQHALGTPRFDPDPMVQLRLIHYCGQLDEARANQVVHLHSRPAWDEWSPAAFLATTVLNEQNYYSRLRTPALVALTWCLRRPVVDPDPAWVRVWREGGGP